MSHFKIPTIKKYISSLENIPKSNIKNILGNVLSQTNSSHLGVFIYNDQDEFKGLISSYKTIYVKNYPYTTKVSSVLYRPPKIKENSPLHEVARYMVSSKIYTLPVFSKNDDLVGVVLAKDMLKCLRNNKKALSFIVEKMRVHKPVIASIRATVGDVYNILRQKGISKVLLVDELGVLSGIVTRSDLKHALIKPTSKMRFAKEGSPAGKYSLAGEKKYRKNLPIRTFSTKVVYVLPDDTQLLDIVTHIIDSPVNNVVLVDKKQVPTGFLSMRDILRAVTQLETKEEILIKIKKPSNAVSQKEIDKIKKYLRSFCTKMKKRISIKRLELITDEVKNTKGFTTQFNTTLMLVPTTGKPFVVSLKNRDFVESVYKSASAIEKIIRRNK